MGVCQRKKSRVDNEETVKEVHEVLDTIDQVETVVQFDGRRC